nr:Mrp/NBP35 family ATP-binding protein [Dictyobacter kobayashii]
MVEIFPESHERRALLDDLPLLGRIPLDPVAVTNGDKGYPIVVSLVDSPVAKVFLEVATQIMQRVALLHAQATEGKAEQAPDDKEEDTHEREA